MVWIRLGRRTWLACGTAMLLACGSPTAPSTGPLTVVRVAGGSTAASSFGAQLLVIRDQAAWESAWQALHGKGSDPGPPPNVNFSSNLIVLVSMGGKPSGGYTVSIPSADEEAGVITVAVTESSPGPTCVVTELITSPYSAVTIPFHVPNEQVKFTITTTVHNCG